YRSHNRVIIDWMYQGEYSDGQPKRPERAKPPEGRRGIRALRLRRRNAFMVCYARPVRSGPSRSGYARREGAVGPRCDAHVRARATADVQSGVAHHRAEGATRLPGLKPAGGAY